ncbi:MAG TPA: hypothetical protein VGZ02_12545 [Candidatus Baltobacteraceae bacterium]|jgi:hypothetical protein|nr:hypothetical protein [Candidatus Baltobacteraceae bacterium]
MRVSPAAVLSGLLCFALPACNSGGSSGGGGSPPNPPSGTTITFSVTGNGASAAAAKIGTGAWASLTLSGNAATFTLPNGTSTYGVAIVCDSIFEFIELLSTSDTTTPSINCPVSGTTATSVSYDVSQIPGATSAHIYVGNAASFQNSVAGAATFNDAPSGTQDLAAIAFGAGATDALAVKIQRGVTVTSALGPLTALNNTDTTSTATVALAGVPSGFNTQVNAWYITKGGAQLTIKDAGSTATYPTVAAADTQSGDYYYLQTFATNTSGSSLSQVGTSQTFSSAQNVSLTFPAPLTYSAPAAAQYPTFAVPSYNGFTISGSTAFIFGAFAPMQNEIIVGTTSSYLSTVGNSLAFPNLSSLPGFLSEPASGHAEDWMAQVFSSTVAGNYLFQLPFPNNAMQQYALASGQFTVP